MISSKDKNAVRKARHARSRRHLIGTSERPRLNVYRSLNHIYAQLVDDDTNAVLLTASTLDKEINGEIKVGYNKDAARAVGKKIAVQALSKGIDTVVFDRGGYKYHGRVKALAEAVRENGLTF